MKKLLLIIPSIILYAFASQQPSRSRLFSLQCDSAFITFGQLTADRGLRPCQIIIDARTTHSMTVYMAGVLKARSAMTHEHWIGNDTASAFTFETPTDTVYAGWTYYPSVSRIKSIPRDSGFAFSWRVTKFSNSDPNN